MVDHAKMARLRFDLDLEVLGEVEPELAGLDSDYLEREAIEGNLDAVYTLALTADAANRLLEAERWWAIAAEHRDPRALHNLGNYAFETGDLAAARSYWEQAADGGCLPAGNNLDALDRHTGGRQQD